jgi:hypothetical protein
MNLNKILITGNVSPHCCDHGRVLYLDVVSIRDCRVRTSGSTVVRCFDYLSTGDIGRTCIHPIVMDENLRKKNRRLLIAIIIFALALCAIVILWKLSIYQKI